MKNVTLYSDDHNNTHLDGFTWVDYAASIQYAREYDSAPYVLNLTSQNTVPTQFRNRTILTTSFSISGYVETESGAPMAGETVTITVPMPGSNFKATVTTNSNGYFSYKCSSDKWYNGWNSNIQANMAEKGVITDWCRYGNLNTMTWMYNTTLTVSCEHSNQSQSYPVVATAATAMYRVLGNRWVYLDGGGNDLLK